MKNLLVTGGAGFIGSNFVRLVNSQFVGLNVFVLDALTYAGDLENLSGTKQTFINGDICNAGLVESTLLNHDIDTVVHFAAETHVDRALFGPAEFVRTNVTGTFTLLEACRKASKRPRVHCISTDETFGSLAPDQAPANEQSIYNPSSVYSASKASADHLTRAYYLTYGLPITITNCTNNYGPRQYPEKLIPLTIMNAANYRAIPVYGAGNQIRDWIHVDDHNEAVLAVLERGKIGETYNVGSGVGTTNLDVVTSICNIVDGLRPYAGDSVNAFRRTDLIRFVADRPGHDKRYAVDTNKIVSTLGWSPKTDLQIGLRKTVKWYLDNVEWMSLIKDKLDASAWMKTNYEGRGKAQ